MMTDDVIFEASFGKDPWGARVVGKMRHFACPEIATVEWLTTGTPRGAGRYEVHGCDILSLRAGKIAAKRSYRKATL